MKRGGWEVRHLPVMTIIHHAGKGGLSPKMEAQDAYARMQYAHKHFSRPHRAAYWLTLGLRIRVALGDCSARRDPGREAVAASSLATLTGRAAPPFGRAARRGGSGPRPGRRPLGDRGTVTAASAELTYHATNQYLEEAP